MKYLVLLLLLGLACCGAESRQRIAPPALEHLRLATFNVHYVDLRPGGAREWDGADWQRRRGAVDLAFKEMQADLIAFQEMESFEGSHFSRLNVQQNWLRNRNPDYALAAFGDPAEFPVTQPIFYRRDRLELLDQGFRYFSENPERIYSWSYDGGFPAYVTWAQFRDRASGRILRAFNAHLDFSSRSNQRRSAALIAGLVAQAQDAGETVFVLIDLNSSPRARPGEALAATGLTFTELRGANYHFNRGFNLTGPVDHILYSAGARSAGPATVLRRRFEGEWPSDHYPVFADYEIGERGG